jgi:hypothetical protein
MRNLLDFSQTHGFQSFLLGLVEAFDPSEADFVQGVTLSECVADKTPDQPTHLALGQIYTKLCVLPEDHTTAAFRQRAANYAARQNFPVIVVERPAAQFYTSVEGSIPLLSGTLGGLLEDGNTGSHFGLTCAHVAQVSGATAALRDVQGTAHSQGAKVIATNFTALQLNKLPRGSVCNPKATGPAPTNQVDAALIELDPALTATNQIDMVGVVSGFMHLPQLSTGDHIAMLGVGSGSSRYRIGGLCVTYKLSMGNDDYCFANLLETFAPPKAAVAGWLRAALATVPQPQDSGAWICRRLSNARRHGQLLLRDAYGW